jgi:hypothetical protein
MEAFRSRGCMREYRRTSHFGRGLSAFDLWWISNDWPGGSHRTIQCAITTERQVIDLPSPRIDVQFNQCRPAVLRPPCRKHDTVPMTSGRLERAPHVCVREPACHEAWISILTFSVSQRTVPETAVVLVVREVPGYCGCVFAGQCRTHCPHRPGEPAIQRYGGGATGWGVRTERRACRSVGRRNDHSRGAVRGQARRCGATRR